ncbi:MAG TPA: hypothetical protein VMP13_07810 [Acidimicrobiia bacterium]|nr:hypothetical protein [Acidimicrobiia bacterium]
MTRLTRARISVEVPPGWEGIIDGGGFEQLSSGARRPTLMQLGSFPLPAGRGSFGSGATELMNSDDILIVLFEYGSESAGTPLYRAEGIPRSLDPADFDRDALQHAIPGQSGVQRFFTENGRAFCLYVVIGSHIDRAELVSKVNQVLASVAIS